MAAIGKRNTLRIVRASGPGLYLDGGDLGEILLPGRYIPRELAPKDLLDVFVYLDSEDRLVATTEMPFAMVDECARMQVITVNPRVGAFLDWGLSKDLLLPFREQERPVRAGQWVVACVYLDEKTNRLVATTRLNRRLKQQSPPEYRKDQPVELIITEKTPLGYTAIVENAHRGLLYHDTLAAPLEIGQELTGYVRAVRPDGKIDLNLSKFGRKKSVASLTSQIVDALEQNGGRLDLDDSSSPEAIQERFGVSKKAFKEALGALYKRRRIQFENGGIQLLDNSAFSPRAK
jgi:uncharacterized protein